MKPHDPVNHPSHYTSDPSGVECIEIARHLPFALGNAVKYLWRAGHKNDLVEDLKKADWYIQDYRNQHNVDSWQTDPALQDLSWKLISKWALYQDPKSDTARAILHILCGQYSDAHYAIEGYINFIKDNI